MNQDVISRLGYQANSRLLVIHADDFGMCQSVNDAVGELFHEGKITSASVMVPCQGFAEAAKYICSNRSADIGVHLTVTSEWAAYKWTPISRDSLSEGFTAPTGAFWPTVHDVLQHAHGSALNELVAQVQMAITCGVTPSHLDNHMFALCRSPELFRDYVAAGERFNLPCLVPPSPSIRTEAFRHFIPDRILQVNMGISPNQWTDYYLKLLRSIPNGISVLLTHPGHDNPELRAITRGSSGWNAQWRQRDFDVLRSPEFRSAILQGDIRLITWQQIRSALIRPATRLS